MQKSLCTTSVCRGKEEVWIAVIDRKVWFWKAAYSQRKVISVAVWIIQFQEEGQLFFPWFRDSYILCPLRLFP